MSNEESILKSQEAIKKNLSKFITEDQMKEFDEYFKSLSESNDSNINDDSIVFNFTKDEIGYEIKIFYNRDRNNFSVLINRRSQKDDIIKEDETILTIFNGILLSINEEIMHKSGSEEQRDHVHIEMHC